MRRGRVLAIVGAWLLLATAACAELPRETVQAIRASVVYIEVTNTSVEGDEETFTGSGFVFDPSGLVLTNQHVVDPGVAGGDRSALEGKQAIEVYFHKGEADEARLDATVLKEHKDADLAVLQLPAGTYAALALGDSDAVEMTQTAYAAGYPLGYSEISIRTGTVTARRTIDGYPYIEHSVNTEQGNSGCPILVDSGEVIAVDAWEPEEARHDTNFAIPAATVRLFLADSLTAPTPTESREDEQYLTNLLTEANFDHERLEPGLYEFTVKGVKLRAQVWQGMVLVQAFLGVADFADDEERLEFYQTLLSLNYRISIGKLGIDEDGDPWLEHSIYQEGLTGDVFRRYARDLALVVSENFE